jgi:hypothetical protein
VRKHKNRDKVKNRGEIWMKYGANMEVKIMNQKICEKLWGENIEQTNRVKI